MKFSIGILMLLSVLACNTKDKNKSDTGEKTGTQTDSLLKQIDEGHVVGMSKIGKLHMAEQRLQEVMDSIKKLPGKTQAAAAAYLDKIKETIADLEYADMAMDKWMMEYNEDSVKDDLNRRLNYLKNETFKVNKMKDAILNGLAKADSLLKAKFD